MPLIIGGGRFNFAPYENEQDKQTALLGQYAHDATAHNDAQAANQARLENGRDDALHQQEEIARHADDVTYRHQQDAIQNTQHQAAFDRAGQWHGDELAHQAASLAQQDRMHADTLQHQKQLRQDALDQAAELRGDSLDERKRKNQSEIEQHDAGLTEAVAKAARAPHERMAAIAEHLGAIGDVQSHMAAADAAEKAARERMQPWNVEAPKPMQLQNPHFPLQDLNDAGSSSSAEPTSEPMQGSTNADASVIGDHPQGALTVADVMAQRAEERAAKFTEQKKRTQGMEDLHAQNTIDRTNKNEEHNANYTVLKRKLDAIADPNEKRLFLEAEERAAVGGQAPTAAERASNHFLEEQMAEAAREARSELALNKMNAENGRYTAKTPDQVWRETHKQNAGHLSTVHRAMNAPEQAAPSTPAAQSTPPAAAPVAPSRASSAVFAARVKQYVAKGWSQQDAEKAVAKQLGQ